MIGDLIERDDWFEGPEGTRWRVVNPWVPIEADDRFAPCVRLEAAESGDYWIDAARFDAQIERGEFSPIDAPEVAADGGESPAEPSDDPDEFSTVLRRLQRGHNSALVLVHDDRTEHLSYYDKSVRHVEAAALEYVQNQGFRIVQAGREYCKVTEKEQAWIEVRRHDPREDDGEDGEES